MSRDGSGNYTLPAAYNPVITNTPIETVWANTTLDDIATALTQSISSTGVTVPSANLPMGGFKHTGVADATLSNQYASYGQLLATSITASSITRVARTSNTIIAAADKAKFFDYTSGTFSQTFQAAATLGAGWYCYARNAGNGEITLDPNSAETIDGLATFVMYAGETRLIFCDGSNLFSTVIVPFYKKYSVAGTYTFVWPPGYNCIQSDLIGGGGGGGSGRRGAAGTARSGGAAGGAPGRYVRNVNSVSAGTSITVTVGSAGSGGTAVSSDNTAGNDGTAGGNSSFGSYAVAYGGCAGKGGDASNVGTSGSGAISAGSSTNTGSGVNGGGPRFNSFGGTSADQRDNIGFGGGGGAATSGNTEYGGAGSAQTDNTGTAVVSAGSSVFGVSAASHGGWITAANTLPATAPDAGLNGSYTAGGGGAGGTCGAVPTAGANGAAATRDDQCGLPGSGGGSSITVAAKEGGAGGGPGGPGGGGGASLNGNNSGAGGSGAAGRVILIGIA